MPLGLNCDYAILTRKAIADRTAQIAQIGQFARAKLAYERHATVNRLRTASNGRQLANAQADSTFAREDLTEAKKALAEANESLQLALEEALIAKSSLPQVDAAFR